MSTKFNINSYISKSLIDNDNCLDIFEELYEYFKPEEPTKITSLIPNNIKNKLSIPISEITKGSQSSSESELSTCYFMNNNIKDIQTSLNFPKSELLIFSNYEPTTYKQPHSKSIDAHHIWKEANIPNIASIQHIELLLLDWAYTYASLEINENKIKQITWNLHNSTKCISSWSGFIKWITCASISN